MNYIMLVCAALLQAGDFAVNKKYQALKGTAPKAVLGFNALLGLGTAVVFFFIGGCKLHFSYFSLSLAAMISVLVMSYNMIGFKILKSGTMALYSLFLMVGGMVAPYIFGVAVLGEPLTILRTAALGLILVGIVLSNGGGDKTTGKVPLAMCIAVFLLNGFVSVISKVHQIDLPLEKVSAAEFVLWGGVARFVIAGILYLSRKEGEEAPSCKPALPLLLILLSAVLSGTSYLLQLFGAVSLPATVLYPFMTGGTIILSTLVGIIFFKEKVSKKLIFGIALCFVGTLLFL